MQKLILENEQHFFVCFISIV